MTERFEELKAKLGQAPQSALWTRAYKLTCLDVGELDAKWKPRANAPPIPMDKGSNQRR